jgi:hypothetical protein
MKELPSPSQTSSLKQRLLDAAEVVDAWRVFPRLYLGFFLAFIYDLHQWYITVATAPDYYANLVFGAISVLTGLYMGSGRKWDG